MSLSSDNLFYSEPSTDKMIIYVIEIPYDAVIKKINLYDPEKYRYDVNKYIIRYIIDIKKSITDKIKTEICDKIEEKEIYCYKTIMRALSTLSFSLLHELKITEHKNFPYLYETYYYTGRVSKQFFHIKGILNGSYKHFSFSGQVIICECFFVDGKIHGECIITENKQKIIFAFNNGNIESHDNEDTIYLYYKNSIPLLLQIS